LASAKDRFATILGLKTLRLTPTK